MMWAGAGDREGKTSVLGSNYRMSQISAALLLNQLKRLDEQNRVRMSNSIYLSDALDEMDGFRSVPRHPDVTVDSVYQYVFRYKRDEFDGVPRETFVEAMNAEGIPVGMGYARPLQDYPLLADIPDSMPGGHPFASGLLQGFRRLLHHRNPGDRTPVQGRVADPAKQCVPRSEVRCRRRNRRRRQGPKQRRRVA